MALSLFSPASYASSVRTEAGAAGQPTFSSPPAGSGTPAQSFATAPSRGDMTLRGSGDGSSPPWGTGTLGDVGSGVPPAAAPVGGETSGHTRYPRPQPQRRMRVQIVMEGWLKKKASHGLTGFKPWQPRYFVLYSNSREIRYYGAVEESVFGNLPIDERGSIPLEYVTNITVPEVDTHGGKRFDLHTARYGEHSYPRDVNGVAASGTGITAAQTKLVTRVFSLEAPTIHDRIAWVRHLRELTGLGVPPALSPPNTSSGATSLMSPGGSTLYSYGAASVGAAYVSAGGSPSASSVPISGAVTSSWPAVQASPARSRMLSGFIPDLAPPPASYSARETTTTSLTRYPTAPADATAERGSSLATAEAAGVSDSATAGRPPPAPSGGIAFSRAGRHDRADDDSTSRRARSSGPAPDENTALTGAPVQRDAYGRPISRRTPVGDAASDAKDAEDRALQQGSRLRPRGSSRAYDMDE